jgi:hypothetical protein
MYWSGYDTAILLTAILTLALAIVPGTALETRKRLAVGGVGAGLVIVSIITGNLRSVVYPSAVWIAPAIPVIAAVVVIVRRQRETAQDEQTFSNPVAEAVASIGTDPVRAAASDPNTPPAELADLAYDHPELRPAIAENPSTYPGLLSWLQQLEDPAVAAAIKRRSGDA